MWLLWLIKSLILCKLILVIKELFDFSKLVSRSNGIQLKVRLGEWDASTPSEPIQAQEFFVTRIFIHPQYNSGNLKNDIAILRLGSSVSLGVTPTITNICLPSNQLSNMRCWVAGECQPSPSNTFDYRLSI